MGFGCCNSFKLCSDAAACIHEGDPAYEGCMYKDNLEKGLNFYTTYNSKNELRKKEYSGGKIKSGDREAKTDVKGDHKRDSYHTYLYILDRCFTIGKRAPYHNHTLYLTEKEQKELSQRLNGFCKCSTDFEKTKCIDENWSDTTPAWYRPIFIINGVKYNIMNYNYRVLTYTTAREIKAFFERKGFDVLIETLGSRGKALLIENNRSKSNRKASPKQKKYEKKPDFEPEQLSLWDLKEMRISS